MKRFFVLSRKDGLETYKEWPNSIVSEIITMVKADRNNVFVNSFTTDIKWQPRFLVTWFVSTYVIWTTRETNFTKEPTVKIKRRLILPPLPLFLYIYIYISAEFSLLNMFDKAEHTFWLPDTCFITEHLKVHSCPIYKYRKLLIENTSVIPPNPFKFVKLTI